MAPKRTGMHILEYVGRYALARAWGLALESAFGAWRDRVRRRRRQRIENDIIDLVVGLWGTGWGWARVAVRDRVDAMGTARWLATEGSSEEEFVFQ